MTISERIDAFVASQGNQVGAGSEFAALLKDIAATAEGCIKPLVITEDVSDGDVRITRDRFYEIVSAVALSYDNHLYLRSSSPTLSKAIFDNISEFDGDGLAFVNNLLLDGTNTPVSYSALVICTKDNNFFLFFKEV